jgi:hypothetical protein
MNNINRYTALETGTIAAASKIVTEEGLYTLLVGSFTEPLTRGNAINAVERLLEMLESELDVDANRLKGRVIFPTDGGQFSTRTFTRFALAFSGIYAADIKDAASLVSECIICEIRMKTVSLADEFSVHSLDSLYPVLQGIEPGDDEEEAKDEYVPAQFVSGTGLAEWYFFRDTIVAKNNAGVVATALGARMTIENTRAISATW